MVKDKTLTKRDIKNIEKYLNISTESLRTFEETIKEMNFKYNDAVNISNSIKELKNSLNIIYDIFPHESHLVDLQASLRERMNNGQQETN